VNLQVNAREGLRDRELTGATGKVSPKGCVWGCALKLLKECVGHVLYQEQSILFASATDQPGRRKKELKEWKGSDREDKAKTGVKSGNWTPLS